MSTLTEILDHNARFVGGREYEAFLTDSFPNKKLAIITCMDTRLIELLPKAMNLRNGDVTMIKVAGAVVAHPFGSVMRSIMVAVYKLGAKEVFVIGHHDCGMVNLKSEDLLDRMQESGVSRDEMRKLNYAGVNLEEWLTGFSKVEDSVRASVRMVRSHPLLPANLPVYGLVIDPATGKLDVVDQPMGVL